MLFYMFKCHSIAILIQSSRGSDSFECKYTDSHRPTWIVQFMTEFHFFTVWRVSSALVVYIGIPGSKETRRTLIRTCNISTSLQAKAKASDHMIEKTERKVLASSSPHLATSLIHIINFVSVNECTVDYGVCVFYLFIGEISLNVCPFGKEGKKIAFCLVCGFHLCFLLSSPLS